MSGSGGEAPERVLPTFRGTVFFLVSVALLFLIVGAALQIFLGELGLLLSQWGVLLGATLAFVAWGRFDLRETLALRWPGGREVAAAFLIIAGGMPLAWFIAWFQSFFIPVPEELLEALRDFLVTDDPLRILWLLFLVAFTPAVCEEVLFRGVLLSGTRRRFTAVWAVVLNGLIFGLFHLSPQTGFRILPTAWLGILLALVVWRTRSIWLAIGMHFLNNAAVLLTTVAPGLRDQFAEVNQAPPPILLPIALVLLAIGLYTLWTVPPAQSVRSGSRGGARPGSFSPLPGEGPRRTGPPPGS